MADRGGDPLIDANDVMWWALFSILAIAPFVVVETLRWPWWTILLVALGLALVTMPLRRRYVRRVHERGRETP
ncbi:hypothetical protein [Nocardioides flavescens]|uniref:Uncharacterized protein n=1 Tax=Nocardioides flavescens TaxID=2691959 RepID=A0A6L7EWW4_9ACTN|nr:hypothetical protein [Nocardioides flavescens]MXG90326.1 hypothetical protein [Nocardioides flavescens]